MLTPTLTPRQARFAAEYLVDLNGTRAAVQAGYSASGAAVTASKLLINTKVAAHVKARQTADAERLRISREKVVVMLQEAFDLAREEREPAAMVSAARELGRMLGFYAPTKATVELNQAAEGELARMERMSDAELLALVQRGKVPPPAGALVFA